MTMKSPVSFWGLVLILGRKLVVGSLDEARCSDKDSDLGVRFMGESCCPFFLGAEVVGVVCMQ